jgi:hypothetical protein
MRSGRPTVAAAGGIRLPELAGTDTPAPPSQTPFGQRGLTTDHHLGMNHTRKSEAWAVWCARAWKNLDRVAIKAG